MFQGQTVVRAIAYAHAQLYCSVPERLTLPFCSERNKRERNGKVAFILVPGTVPQRFGTVFKPSVNGV